MFGERTKAAEIILIDWALIAHLGLQIVDGFGKIATVLVEINVFS